MAETSGFMTDLPQSAYLSLSMKRAISAAQQRSHRYVTLEHLLLALLDDPAATDILEGIRADLPSIRVAAVETVNHNLVTLHTPGEFDLRASYKVERVLQTASDDANRLGCHEVDAAFVLAALSRETDSPAAEILKRNGFSYSGAVTWLYANRGSSPASRAARSKSQPSIAAVPKPDPAPPPKAEPEAARKIFSRSEEDDAGTPTPAGNADERQSPDTAEEEPLELSHEIAEEIREELSPLSKPQSSKELKHPSSDQPPRSILRREEAREGSSDDGEPNKPPGSKSAPASPPKPEGSLEKRLSEAARGDRDDGSARFRQGRRPEPAVPPPSRLEEMRLGTSGGGSKWKTPHPGPALAPPPPTPPKKRGRKRSASQTDPMQMSAPERQRGRARRPPRAHEVLIGRLIENIPRRMRAAVAERIEVRISHEETQMLSRGLEGRAEPMRHDIMVTQTMSVALRAPDSGFTIEPLSPETQWIFDRPDDGEAYGRWRWVVTPHAPGQRRLQLIVAARSIDQNGLVGDTALPDQIITVRVRTNYWRSMGRGLQWIAAMLIGGVLTELAMMGMRMFGE